ncbi:MAG: ABC transporter ATP-binding protein [Planctomycetota bacterium]
MSAPLLSARGASKWYGQVIAVNDVTLDIQPGITALLGPNGAGKSTLLGLFTGQLRPTRGLVEAFGEPIWDNPRLNERIGLCHQYDNFYEEMTAVEFLRFICRLTGFRGTAARQRADYVLDRVGLEKCDRVRAIRTYSKGMRQRTKLAQALVHEPELLFLDEPMTGLDPVGRYEISKLLEGLAKMGKSIVVSTHILHEVEALTDQILLLAEGRILAEGDIHQIRASLEQHPYQIRVVSNAARALAVLLTADEHVSAVKIQELTVDREALTISTTRADLVFDSLPRHAQTAGAYIEEISCPDDNLESVFDYLVGQ